MKNKHRDKDVNSAAFVKKKGQFVWPSCKRRPTGHEEVSEKANFERYNADILQWTGSQLNEHVTAFLTDHGASFCHTTLDGGTII